jgi:hypothetical protein
MPQSFEPLNLPFSTADADAPVLAYDLGQLHVRFRDWQDKEVALTFRNVALFSWDDGDAAWSSGHRDDICYTVIGSEWLKRHLDVGTISAGEGHHHYKLCFNAAGVLQVISAGYEILV